MNEGIFGDAFSEPDMGMGGYMNPIANTELQRLGRLPAKPIQQQGPQDNIAALLGLLSMGHGGIGSLMGGPQTQDNFNDVRSASNLAVPGIGALFYHLFANENSPGQRFVNRLGDKVIQPLAHFGGRASVQSQLDRMNSFGPLGLFGSGHLERHVPGEPIQQGNSGLNRNI